MTTNITPSPCDIKALTINQNHDGTTTVIIQNYADEVLAQRTVTSASLNWVVKDMGRTAIEIAHENGVRYNQVNRYYALGLWRKQ